MIDRFKPGRRAAIVLVSVLAVVLVLLFAVDVREPRSCDEQDYIVAVKVEEVNDTSGLPGEVVGVSSPSPKLREAISKGRVTYSGLSESQIDDLSRQYDVWAREAHFEYNGTTYRFSYVIPIGGLTLHDCPFKVYIIDAPVLEIG